MGDVFCANDRNFWRLAKGHAPDVSVDGKLLETITRTEGETVFEIRRRVLFVSELDSAEWRQPADDQATNAHTTRLSFFPFAKTPQILFHVEDCESDALRLLSDFSKLKCIAEESMFDKLI